MKKDEKRTVVIPNKSFNDAENIRAPKHTSSQHPDSSQESKKDEKK